MAPRTSKRSSSRAHAICPQCAKRLSGDKGLIKHLSEVHSITPDVAGKLYGVVEGRRP